MNRNLLNALIIGSNGLVIFFLMATGSVPDSTLKILLIAFGTADILVGIISALRITLRRLNA
jgi:hypothetical protein